MSDQTPTKWPPKFKTSLINTITSDEEDIRFRIYTGAIPLWEYHEELRKRQKIQYDNHIKRLTEDLIALRDHYLYRELERDRLIVLYKDLWDISRKLRVNLEDNLTCFIKDYKFLSVLNSLAYSYLKEERNRNKILLKRLESYKVLIRVLNRRLKENQMLPNVQHKVHSVLNSLQGTPKRIEEEMDNIIDLQQRVKEKNKGTDSGMSGKNWLSELAVDTYFVCEPLHPQDPSPLQHEYILVDKTDKSVKLRTNMNEPEVDIRVNPVKFCQLYQLIEILKDGE